MTPPHARDESIGRWLESAGPSGHQAGQSCLDAETAAAWLDGGLTASALEKARSHASDCGRCQALLATLATAHDLSTAEPEPAWNWRRWLTWAAPVAAAATVVVALVVWVNVPVPPEPEVVAAVAAAAKPAAEPQPVGAETSSALKALRAEAPAPPDSLGRLAAAQGDVPAPSVSGAAKPSAPAEPAAVPPPAPRAALSLERRALDAPALKVETAEQANAVQAMAAPARALADTESAAREVASPDPAIRWRISGDGVQRSRDRGATWVPEDTGVSARITAWAAPSASVCWLVGSGGVVLLMTDGRRWTRAPFPEQADLSAVSARDALTATVITVDGRSFTTSDAGRTWTPR